MEMAEIALVVLNLVGWFVIIGAVGLFYRRLHSTMNELIQTEKRALNALSDLEKDVDLVIKQLGESQTIANLTIGAKDSPSLEDEQEAFKKGSSSIRWKAVSAAAQQSQKAASSNDIQTLVNSLHDESVRVRLGAMSALARTGNRDAVPPVIELLKDENEVIRRRARKSLIELTSQDFGDQIELWKQWYEKESH